MKALGTFYLDCRFNHEAKFFQGKNSHLIIHSPMSEGVNKVCERAIELAERASEASSAEQANK